MEHLFFYIGLSFILTHELDAIRLKEWIVFPLLSSLNENLGFKIFTILHIPLFILLFYGLNTNEEQTIMWLDIFFIVHIGLHLLILKNRKNPFKSIFSWTIIILSGFFGLLDLVL
jgi:hypothetical protein